MKLLIIGCNGFIGSHVFNFFKSKNYVVTGADITASNHLNFLLQSDLSNLNALFLRQQFDMCINASGSATVSYSISHEAHDLILNFKNVEAILECIKKYQPQCKLINLSSAAVYGNPVKLPINEEDEKNPISPYGKHKLLSEKLLREFHLKYGISTLSLRVFSAYGNGLKKQLFWDIYQKSLQSSVIQLQGKGNETRDFIHVDDLTQAFEKIIQNAQFNGGAINVASGNECSIGKAANYLVQLLNKDLSIEFTGAQNSSNPLFWSADISQLAALGFVPLVNLENGLNQYASWLKGLN